jgi:hypothetical protein
VTYNEPHSYVIGQPQTEITTETRKKLGEQEEEALKKKPTLRN